MPGEMVEQRDGRRVEQRYVVGHSYHARIVMPLQKGLPGVLEERFRVELPIGVAVAEPCGKQAGHRAERQGGRGAAADHAFGRVAVSSCHVAALVSQPGLADSGRANDHQAGLASGVQGLLEDLDFGASADDRPPPHRNCHASSMAARRRNATSQTDSGRQVRIRLSRGADAG